MTNTRIDVTTRYSRNADLPETREIEVAEQLELLTDDPPKTTVQREPYLADAALEDAVNLAIALGRPLLLQGDPGCGKTMLAYAVAYALGLPLETAIIKSTSRGQDLLYTYDAVNRLYDAQLGVGARKDQNDQPRVHNIHNYIRLGPLGRAIVRAGYGRRSVVLLDEIDKADIDFPNDLLWELDRLEFRVEESRYLHYAVGDRPELRPIVFVTHNEEKALPVAFLRRCIFHYVEYPKTQADVERILVMHNVEDKALRTKAVEVVARLRTLDLSKRPGLSELIDWVGYLEAMQSNADELDQLPYLGALLKQRDDQQRARQEYGARD